MLHVINNSAVFTCVLLLVSSQSHCASVWSVAIKLSKSVLCF